MSWKIAVRPYFLMPFTLIQNRHSAEGEFRAHGQPKALEKSDLDMQAGMNKKERRKLHRRGQVGRRSKNLRQAFFEHFQMLAESALLRDLFEPARRFV
ncbi:MAG: hypothetical protein AAB676_20825, partial [Verrucomicrobiota bacterium]